MRSSRLLSVVAVAATLVLLAAAGKRVHLFPKYAAGETLRYRIESHSTSSAKITTPILNPEGATRSTLAIHLLVRLDILGAPPAGSPGAAQIRATYEKSSADSDSDAFDPAQPSPSKQYARLEGRSLEFTVDPRGQLAGIKGLEDVFADRASAQASLSWFGEISAASAIPAAGVEIGQKWKTEHPVEGAPLADLTWRAESTYLRDEACSADPGAAAQGAQLSAPPETCAVILTQFTISRRGAAHSEATPDDYRRNGLRVSGSWDGSGESLDDISLANGFLVRSTQTSDQQMDYEIASAASGSKIHNQSRVQSQTEIVLSVAAPIEGR